VNIACRSVIEENGRRALEVKQLTPRNCLKIKALLAKH
jgi:hypothetical protein